MPNAEAESGAIRPENREVAGDLAMRTQQAEILSNQHRSLEAAQAAVSAYGLIDQYPSVRNLIETETYSERVLDVLSDSMRVMSRGERIAFTEKNRELVTKMLVEKAELERQRALASRAQ